MQDFPIRNGDTYSGYVLVLQQDWLSFDKLHDRGIVAGIGGLIPNPPKSMRVAPADHLYFTSQSDAERAKNGLAHAAILCGAKADPF
jgi:hypothetical protein